MSRIVMRDELDSTMDELHRLAAEGGEEGLAVVATRQSASRGRLGRRWVAEEGGLWLSVLMRNPGGDELEVLSPRIGIAVARAIQTAIPPLPRLMVKWPNDLRLKGRKVGGLLIEARWQAGVAEWVVIGVGINLRNRVPTALANSAMSLSEVTTVPTPEAMAPVVIDAVRHAMSRRGTLHPDELEEWSLRDDLIGQQLMSPAMGIAEGITADGSLRIRDRMGHLTLVRTGEVAADGTLTRN